MIAIDYQEGKKLSESCLCGECGSPLVLCWGGKWGIESHVLRCAKDENHKGIVEQETYTQAFRRGEGAPLVIKDKIEKKMLPGGYPLGTALALIKTRFPRADMDDPSAALFVMDCMRLDLDPLLGEIVPVTFKSTDKATGEVRKVVTPILTEDGWLSLAARACPDRWAGPPITEPVTDKELRKNLCDDEEAWVWKATGKTKDGTESVTYGWLKRKEYERAKQAGTPAGELPGNQARVRAIKRWVRETFPEAKAKMKEMTSEWLTRGKDVEGVQQIIEAEYHIVAEAPSKGGEEKGAAGAPGKGKGGEAAVASPSKQEVKTQKSAGAPPAELEGEGFHIDLDWLNDALREIKWSDDTCKTFLVSKYKVSPTGTLTEVIKRLTQEQAEEFVKEIQEKTAKKQAELW